MLTPPKRAYTPSSPPPIGQPVIDQHFGLLSMETSDRYKLQPVDSRSRGRALSVSSNSSEETATPSRSPPHRALPVPSRSSAPRL
ncbi:hypothetical protein FRC08_018148 [Ceratobasidium sp. 394]|nr:hypothetical protein FRC08_018148 [Ceratobasidium sp. 394]